MNISSSSFRMIKYAPIYLVLLEVLIGSLAYAAREEQNPFWSIFIGHNDKKDTITKFDSNATNKGYQQDRAETLKSTIPLVQLGDTSYYFGTYFKGNFFKSMQFCRDLGMELLSIESSEENSIIISYITSHVSKIDNFWTSGSDLGEEGKFVWLATGKSFNYTDWAPPQPDNANNNEHCMKIWKAGEKHYVWNDIPCNSEYNFICEMRKCSEFCVQ